MARGVDRLSGPQAGSGGFAGGVCAPVPDVELRPGCSVLAGPRYERSGNHGACPEFLSSPPPTRFPLTYFGAKAAERVRPEPEGIGASPLNPAEFLSVIPAAPPLPPLDQPLAAKAQEQQARARALSDIAFDASAELEYRAAYADDALAEISGRRRRSRSRRRTLRGGHGCDAAGVSRSSRRGACRKFRTKLGGRHFRCLTNRACEAPLRATNWTRCSWPG